MKRRMVKKMWSILKGIIENWNVITFFAFFNRISGIIFYSDIDIKILPFERKVCLHKMVVSKEIFIPIPSFIRFKNLFSPVVYFQIHKKYIGKKEEKRRKKERKKRGEYTKFVSMLTTAGYIQIQKQAVLALVGKEHVQTFQLLVSAQRHLQQSSCVIADVRKVLRANCAERIRQFDTVPRDRWDRWSKT